MRPVRKVKLWMCILFVTLSFSITSCLVKKHKNFTNKDGYRQGLWIGYWDDEKEIPMSKAWFKNDKEYKSKEYHINGKKRLKMNWQPHRIKVKYFDTTGTLEQKGWAKFEVTEKEIRYYWQGTWKYYNDNRKLVRITQYVNGEEVSNE